MLNGKVEIAERTSYIDRMNKIHNNSNVLFFTKDTNVLNVLLIKYRYSIVCIFLDFVIGTFCILVLIIFLAMALSLSDSCCLRVFLI
jgi:hypothetical protein